MLSALRLGQEIEYEYQYKRGRVERHVGRIQQITSRHIAVQGRLYSDSIALADLISGQAKITSPALDFEGIQMHNRTQEIEAEAERQEVKDKIEAVQEQEVERVEAAKTSENTWPTMAALKGRQRVKYDWPALDPQIEKLWGQGLSVSAIARELNVEKSAMSSRIRGIKGYRYFKPLNLVKKTQKNVQSCDQPIPPLRPTIEPAEEKVFVSEGADICPAGRVEVIIDVETGEVISEEVYNTLGDDIAVTEKREPAAMPVIAVAGDYQRKIFERFHQQREKGIQKYGQPLEDNPASRDERLEHLAQELTDGLMYIEWLKEQPEKPMLGLPDVNWQKHGWTLPGQLKKVFEEAGEVAEAVANQNAMEILKEALDTMQTCKTMISMVLAVETWIDLAQLLEDHTRKLERKGYL